MVRAIQSLPASLAVVAFLGLGACGQAPAPGAAAPPAPGAAAGEGPTDVVPESRTVVVEGAKLYLELHGAGPPLLLLHGNGGNGATLWRQTQFFRTHFQVIVLDSRGQGKSEMGEGRLTYERMAEDCNAVLEELRMKPVSVLGYSDGGIIGLLLAMRHPDKVAKLAVMGANLNPEGACDYAQEFVLDQEKQIDEMIARGDHTRPWATYKQYFDLLAHQPHIPLSDLAGVKAPTLVMAGDKDLIRNEHTVEIFQALPNAQMCIFPGATHFIGADDPARFNETVDRFLVRPFSRLDSRSGFGQPTAKH